MIRTTMFVLLGVFQGMLLMYCVMAERRSVEIVQVPTPAAYVINIGVAR